MQPILCRSETQARQRREQHNAARRQAGDQVWTTAPILSLDRYLRDSWLKSWPTEQLLSPSQEWLLWQQLVHADRRAGQLLAPRQLARRLAASWSRACAWNLDWRSGPHWTEEQRCFQRLATAFAARLGDAGLISAAQLPTALRERHNAGLAPTPPALEIAAEPADFSPDRQQLLRAWQAAGTQITFSSPAEATAIDAWHTPDPESQWQRVADDMRPALEDAQHIILALPRLDAGLREEIQLALRDRLAPWMRQASPEECPWRFEPADSLASQPVIMAACVALEPAAFDNRFQSLSKLLLQPALFAPTERAVTAEREAALRERGPRFGITALLPRDDDDSPLAARLRDYVACVQQAPPRATARDWLDHWRARWQALEFATSGPDWPLGEEFDQALLEFCGLDPWLGPVDAGTALAWLRQILGRLRFRPAMTHEPLLTICDFQSAVGVHCDWLILANLDNRQWPPPAQADPLLNLEQQVAAGDPAASATGQLRHARRLIDQLSRQAPRVTACCALSDAQAALQRPSPVVNARWQARPVEPCATEQPPAELPANDAVPPLALARARQQRGGHRIVQAQAYGPFFAFVRHRLGVSALPTPLLGLSPRDQGLWIHAVLENFWLETRDQARLLALSPDELEQSVAERSAALADRFLPRGRYGNGLRALELDRVQRACLHWLQHEQRRQDPFEVLHCEQELRENIGPLELRLRIDRIDRCDTADGPRYLIIDYKSGSSERHKYWQTHQFYEPQLPLYAVSQKLAELGVPQVDGICFAHVVDGAPMFAASLNWRSRLIEEQKQAFHCDWESTLADWRGRLDELLEEFLAGGAVTLDRNKNYHREMAVADLLPLVDALPQGDEDV